MGCVLSFQQMTQFVYNRTRIVSIHRRFIFQHGYRVEWPPHWIFYLINAYFPPTVELHFSYIIILTKYFWALSKLFVMLNTCCSIARVQNARGRKCKKSFFYLCWCEKKGGEIDQSLNTVVGDSLRAVVRWYLITQFNSCPLERLRQYLNGTGSLTIVEFSSLQYTSIQYSTV